MTTIIGYRFEDTYVLAADSQTTCGDYISNSRSMKIFETPKHWYAAAGCVSNDILIEEYLQDESRRRIRTQSPINAIVLKKHRNIKGGITSVTEVSGKGLVERIDVLKQVGSLFTLGSGGKYFQTVFKTVLHERGEPKDKEELRKLLETSFKLTSEIDLYSNNNVHYRWFEIVP